MKKITKLFVAGLALVSSCKKDVSTNPQERIIHSKVLVEESSPEVKGELVTFPLADGSSLTLERKNGRYIMGGDMLLTDEQVEIMKKAGPKKHGQSTKSTFMYDPFKLWPGGVVYYTIAGDVFDATIINDAITYWESHTLIQFVPRTTQPNYVRFQPGSGNDSEIGMVGGRQNININSSAIKGNVMHEIGHAIGLLHEQTRADRDRYITIDFSNIRSDKKHNFYIYESPGGELRSLDFHSIMMYSSVTGFEINSSQPSIRKSNGTTFWAQRDSLSSGDINGVNFLYDYANFKAVYLKIFYTNVVDNSWWSGSSDVTLIDRDVNVELFEDPACTIPYTSTFEINVKGEYYRGGGYGYEVIPVGVHTYMLTQDHIERYYESGNLVGDGSTGMTIISSFGYAAVY